MKLSSKLKNNYLLLAFAIPFFGMLLVMAISRYRPFGDYSMLYSDMYHQYYPFFAAYRRMLLSGDSLLYSWNVGMGMDYLGLIAYYLASPLNLFSILVPERFLLSFFSLLLPLRLGLASLFFAIFLKEIFEKYDLSIAVFASFYGLCAWALAFQWNIMWLDTFALLPLVVLGEIRLVRDRKFLLYTLTLFLSVFSNYYIGLFTCIFVALVFFCYEFCRFRSWKRLCGDFICIACFSLIAIGLTAILTVPAFFALQTTQSSVNKFPHGFKLNIASSSTFLGLIDAMRQVIGNSGGGIEPSFKEGLPNLYCGVGTIILVFLYLISEQVSWKDKVCAVFLLLFFNVSFIIRQLDYIWHGFHFTNMIPYRFSFLYSFVMLYMAYRAWTLRRSFDSLEVIAAGFLSAAVLTCATALTHTEHLELFSFSFNIPVFIVYNVPFLLLFLGALLFSTRRTVPKGDSLEEKLKLLRARTLRRRYASRAFLAITGLELAATLLAFGLYFPGTYVSNYPKGTEEAASMIRYMKERESDTLFYRAETTHSQTLNDGALNNYNGISTFTSSANVRTTEFMEALGYGAKNTYNRYCYEEASPVANLFLDLKYMIERDGRHRQSSMFYDVHHFGNVHLLKNEAYLPLGFLAESALAEVDFNDSTFPFAFQNRLFAAATGLDGEIWHRVQGNNLELLPDRVSITDQNTNGYCQYSNAEGGSNVVYCYTIDEAGFACIHVNLPKRNTIHIRVNGDELYRETISLPQMFAVSDVRSGDVVEIQVETTAGESGTMSVALCTLNNDLFWKGYQKLNASTLKLTKFSNTSVQGTIECDRDGLLYTSIPQNGNWHAAVDGEEAQITLVGDCMIALPMAVGSHTVQLSYQNDAFSIGWKISLLCAVSLATAVQLIYKPDWKKLLKRNKTA